MMSYNANYALHAGEMKDTQERKEEDE